MEYGLPEGEYPRLQEKLSASEIIYLFTEYLRAEAAPNPDKSRDWLLVVLPMNFPGFGRTLLRDTRFKILKPRRQPRTFEPKMPVQNEVPGGQGENCDE